MLDLLKRLCSTINNKCRNRSIVTNSTTPLLTSIDLGVDNSKIINYISNNPSSLYEFDDNFDVLCHSISKLNLELVLHLLNSHDILWDYSTALFVLTNVRINENDVYNKKKATTIYRLLLEKCGNKIFTGYEMLNCINRNNKTFIYLMILDGIFEEDVCMKVLSQSQVEIDLELSIFLKYYKNLYNTFKSLKSECKEEVENKEECKTECKEEVENKEECKEVCPVSYNLDDTKEEKVENSLTVVKYSENRDNIDSENFLIHEEVNDETTLRDIAPIEVVDKILQHMKQNNN